MSVFFHFETAACAREVDDLLERYGYHVSGNLWHFADSLRNRIQTLSKRGLRERKMNYNLLQNYTVEYVFLPV